MDFRNMLKGVFGTGGDKKTATVYKLLNSYENYFYPVADCIYDDATVRTCIDAIAKNVAKLKISHNRRKGDAVTLVENRLNYLLGTRPNEYMSAYDFIYKIVSQVYCHNNSFTYVRRDPVGNIIGFYPLDYGSVSLVECEGEMYCRFAFMQAGFVTVPYTSIIHIRKHYNNHDVFGDSNKAILEENLSLLTTLKQGLKKAVKEGSRIKGLLKFTGILRPEDQQAQLDLFTNNIKSTSNGSGIGTTDAKADFIELKSQNTTANDTQMNLVREDIYRYFGVSEKIITANYTESEWNAFFESVIEPLAIQMSQEFTAKVFSEKERGFGNEITFTMNRLEYVSLDSKVNLVQVLQQTGVMTINELREIFGFSALPDGGKRLVSLNYVNSEKQDKYQVNEDVKITEEGESKGE
jgi:HK97 family phage portal protein